MGILVDERCKELHEANLIQPSSFDFVAAIIMLAKKDLIGLWTEKKMCEDYKPLNLVTLSIGTPCPSPKNSLITLEIKTFS
jgi:hypothetical protein